MSKVIMRPYGERGMPLFILTLGYFYQLFDFIVRKSTDFSFIINGK